NFRSRHTSQQNAVHERCVKIIKPRKAVAVAFQNCLDQHHFDRRLVRLLGGGGCWAGQKHVGGGVHRAVSIVLSVLVFGSGWWFSRERSAISEDPDPKTEDLLPNNTD